MIHILKKEFIDSFKSIRTILIVLFITSISYLTASTVNDNPGIVNNLLAAQEGIDSVYTAVLSLIILLLGFLFIFSTSHDVMNREFELRTIRLLVTKQSRLEVILGKFLGTFLFWVFILSISFGIISIFAGEFFAGDYFKLLSYLFYTVSFVVMLSTVVTKTRITMFLGILLGISLPIIGMIALFSEKEYMLIFKYILPYYYLDGSFVLASVPLAIGLIYLLIAIVMFQRKDL